MKDECNPLTTLFTEVSPTSMIESLDSVLIDYAITCVNEGQSASTEEAVSNIRKIKMLLDALKKSSNVL